MTKNLYVTVYRSGVGNGLVICTTHKSLKAAIKAKRSCERNGGERHRIYKLVEQK